jgi:hypothetical protein
MGLGQPASGTQGLRPGLSCGAPPELRPSPTESILSATNLG